MKVVTVYAKVLVEPSAPAAAACGGGPIGARCGVVLSGCWVAVVCLSGSQVLYNTIWWRMVVGACFL